MTFIRNADEDSDATESDGEEKEGSRSRSPSPSQGTNVDVKESKDSESVGQVELVPEVPDTADPELTLIYSPGATLARHVGRCIGKLVEVRIAAKYLTVHNKEVAARHLWGTDVYSVDSDCAALVAHAGT
jgi:hypothetical protein